MGEVSLEGVGLPQNYLDAHMWFNLSGSQGNKKAIKNRNRLERKMSPEQTGGTQKMAKRWMPNKSKSFLDKFKERVSAN